jgi:hypothetical protein
VACLWRVRYDGGSDESCTCHAWKFIPSWLICKLRPLTPRLNTEWSPPLLPTLSTCLCVVRVRNAYCSTVFLSLYSLALRLIQSSGSQHFMRDPKVANGMWPATLPWKRQWSVIFNPFKTKPVFYIRIQCVPRIKHPTSVIKNNQLMLYKAKVAVCSEIRTKHINAMWAPRRIF